MSPIPVVRPLSYQWSESRSLSFSIHGAMFILFICVNNVIRRKSNKDTIKNRTIRIQCLSKVNTPNHNLPMDSIVSVISWLVDWVSSSRTKEMNI